MDKNRYRVLLIKLLVALKRSCLSETKEKHIFFGIKPKKKWRFSMSRAIVHPDYGQVSKTHEHGTIVYTRSCKM